MSKLFYRVIFEDINPTNCTSEEVDYLADLIKPTVKRTATTLIRKATFDLHDFFNISKEFEDFTLLIERKTINKKDFWFCVFSKGNKTLELTLSLEKD